MRIAPKIKAVKFFRQAAPRHMDAVRVEQGASRGSAHSKRRPTVNIVFAFPTVDDDRPADVRARATRGPSIVVMVDTQVPEISVKPIVVASGQTYIQCMMRDDNPDASTLVAEYEVADGAWRPLLATGKDMPGVVSLGGRQAAE